VSIFNCDVLADAAAATDTIEKKKIKRPPGPGECAVVPFPTHAAVHFRVDAM
jgi:hypothetical protein